MVGRDDRSCCSFGHINYGRTCFSFAMSNDFALAGVVLQALLFILSFSFLLLLLLLFYSPSILSLGRPVLFIFLNENLPCFSLYYYIYPSCVMFVYSDLRREKEDEMLALLETIKIKTLFEKHNFTFSHYCLNDVCISSSLKNISIKMQVLGLFSQQPR